MNNSLSSLEFCNAAKTMIDLWRSLPIEAGKICPYKASFSPAPMRQYLKNVILYKHIDDYKIITRVAGTSIREFMGLDLTGKDLMNYLPPEYINAYQVYYTNLRAMPCAGTAERPIRGAGGTSYLARTLHLPLLGETGEVEYYVGVSKAYPLPKHYTDYRSISVTSANNLIIKYSDIGAGIPYTEPSLLLAE